MADVQVELIRRVSVEDHAGDRLEFRSVGPGNECLHSDDSDVTCVVEVKADGVHLTAHELRALAAVLDEWASFAEQEQNEAATCEGGC